MMRKRCILIIKILLVVIVLVLTPYIAEKLIIKIYGDPFNIKIMLSKEAWFGFISSYLGAIGTIVLGIIAIWQNGRYKELSDNSSKEVMFIQKELKELNKRTVDAIETLEKIEVAIYTPAIQLIQNTFYGISKESLEKGNDVCAYQKNYIYTDPSDFSMPLDKLMYKYSTYGFSVCNIGEKTIRNFTCRKIKINEETPASIFNVSTDIMSGETAYILFVNLPLETETTNLELDFDFKTLLLEKYVFHVEVVIVQEENSLSSYFYQL